MIKELSMDTSDVLEEIEKRFYDIPFENSQFQNQNFVIHAAQTPARAYRSIGLKIYSKLNAINELKFSKMESQVDIDEWNSIINSENSSEFEKRRAKISIDRKLSMTQYTEKLLNDAITELNFLYSKVKEFPEYTRKQFESEERDHFTHKFNLNLSAGGNGTKESLALISNDDIFNKNLSESIKKIGYEQSKNSI